jgi:hypothetical protein
MNQAQTSLRPTFKACNKTDGDCPNFAESSEQKGTVPFSETLTANRTLAEPVPPQTQHTV